MKLSSFSHQVNTSQTNPINKCREKRVDCKQKQIVNLNIDKRYGQQKKNND